MESGLRDQGSRIRVPGFRLEFRGYGSEFGVRHLGLRTQG